MIDKQVTYAAGDEQTAEGPLTPLILHTQEESSSTSSTHICRPDGSSDSSDSRKIKQSKVRFGHNIAFAEDEDVERSPRCSEAGGRSMAKRALYKRLLSNPKDELRHFRSGLLWLGLDQSSPTKVVLSWIVFFLFTLVVPVFNYNFVSCSECGEEHAHPFEKMVQVSETALAAVSFLCLSNIVRQYGLRRTLLLDKIIKESHDVRLGYEQELRVSSLSLCLSLHTHTMQCIYLQFQKHFIDLCTDSTRDLGLLSWSFAERLLVTGMDSSALLPDRADFQGVVVYICFHHYPLRSCRLKAERVALLHRHALMALPHLSFSFHVRPIQADVLSPNPSSQGVQKAAGGHTRRVCHPL
jgi:hypothetical protein